MSGESPVNYELQMKIADWRRRSVEGTLTLEEMKEAIALLRSGRMAAAAASSEGKRKLAKAVIVDADDLLSEI